MAGPRIASLAVSKKLEQKQARREAEERRAAEQRKAAFRRNIVTIGTALVVAVIVIVAIVLQRESGEGPGAPDNVGVAAAQAGCEDIEEFDELEAAHIQVDEEHEPYNSSPPTSGPHYEIASDTGFFEESLEPEQVVHNLEHGQIVIWYSPDAPSEVIADIENVVEQEPIATVAHPYADIESPYNFVLTGWTAAQRCEEVSQDVVDDFRREYQGMGPEKITPPFEG